VTGLSASSVLQFSTSVVYDIGLGTPEDPVCHLVSLVKLPNWQLHADPMCPAS
jgi:hypothetical protein